MNIKSLYILALSLSVLFTSCGQDEFNSDNSIPEYPEANISTLREAPYPIGAALNVNTLKNNQKYRETVIREMNSITAENAMKMNLLSAGRGQYNWTDADYLVNFAESNNMRVHGHTLIWYKHTPAWVESFTGTTEDWKALMKEYIQDVVGHYKGRVASWDVVNDIYDETTQELRSCVWLTNIGPEYIELAFRYAHEADPDALLFYNEFGNEWSHAQRSFTKHLADSLSSKGVPIHGIGIQMHTNINRSSNDLRYAIIAAAQTKLKVHVSELDIAVNPDKKPDLVFTDDLALKQKEKYRVVSEAMLDIPQSQQYGITFWGVADPTSWLISGPDWVLPFDANYEKKPAYSGLLQGLYQ